MFYRRREVRFSGSIDDDTGSKPVAYDSNGGTLEKPDEDGIKAVSSCCRYEKKNP